MSHEHRWWPVPLERGQYVCGCGRTGYRDSSGRLRAHARTRLRRPEVDVQPRRDVEPSQGQDDMGHRAAPGCGRVPAKRGAP